MNADDFRLESTEDHGEPIVIVRCPARFCRWSWDQWSPSLGDVREAIAAHIAEAHP